MQMLCKLFFVVFLQSIFVSTVFSAEKITLQLRWLHQFQFAGYYAAIEKGYYRDADIGVVLSEGGDGVNTIDQVLNGAAQYGVTNSELLLHRAQGKSVVVLAAIFQHSPLVFLARRETGISHPHDFIGKRVKMSRTSRDIELHAMLRNEGVSLDQFTLLEELARPEDYLDKEIDVVAAYITNQSYYLEEAGVAYTAITPSSYGVDFYGDTLFTTQEEIKTHPGRVEAFKEASLRGWEYAMAHPEEIIDVLIEKYDCKKSRAHLLSEAKKMQKLILPAMIEMGHMNPGRWQHICQIFIDNGVLQPDFSLDGFIYSSLEGADYRKLYRIGGLLLFCILGFGAVAVSLFVFNKRLQREMVERKKTEKALIYSQEKIANFAEQIEQFSLSAASIVSIKDEKVLFAKISDAIVKFSDYERVLISLFNDFPPYRDLIGYAGVSKEIVDKVKSTELDKTWYDRVFERGVLFGQFSYYIPHTMKHILKQEATIYGEGEVPDGPDSWHPEDNLFVRMTGEDGEFIGVISVDTSKSGLKPTDDIVRPLEVYASLISQIIILKRNHNKREQLEQQLRQAQKMEAIGILTGGIAHDFNNILSVIIGNVELALETTARDSSNATCLEEISKASNRAKDIVRHLLSFSRKTERELKPIQIGTVLEDGIGFFSATIPSTIKVRTDIRLGRYSVLADPTQIYQIILNLCTNAVHAMEMDGGALYVGAGVVNLSKGNHKVSEEELQPGEYVEITIKDTGSGIDTEQIDKIFDPYYTTKEVGKGTGMGLAIVRGIVRSHNGAIQVFSESGIGSTFKIHFPVYSGAYKEEEIEKRVVAEGTGRILLVDDDVNLLEIISRHLRRIGYEVDVFENPVKALERFSQASKEYDLVVTDMTMPQMTGDVLAQNILSINPELPIFLCTGYSNIIDEDRALEIGIRRYFEKPVVFAKFAHALREELVNNQRMRNES